MVVLSVDPMKSVQDQYKNGLDSINNPCYRKTLKKQFPITSYHLSYHLMREKPKHLSMGRLSLRILTTAGPDMKSPSLSTTELRSRRDPPPATTGAVCPQNRANALLQVLRIQDNVPED